MADITLYIIGLVSPYGHVVVWGLDEPQQPAVYINLGEAERYRRYIASKHPKETYEVLTCTVSDTRYTVVEFYPADPEQDESGRLSSG